MPARLAPPKKYRRPRYRRDALRTRPATAACTQWVWGPFVPRDGGWDLPPGCYAAIDFRTLADQQRPFAGIRNFALFAARLDARFGVDHHVIGRGGPQDVRFGERFRWRVFNDLRLPKVPQATTPLELAAELLLLHSDPDGSSMARPLVPTTRLQWEVHLGGHKWSVPFSFAHRGYATLRDNLRRDFAKIRDEVESGLCAPNMHRKWIGYQCLKYRGWLDDGWAMELVGETPWKPETVYTESFNKTNSTILGPDLTWTEPSGNFSIVSNRARPTTFSPRAEARIASDLSSSDNYAEITQYMATSNQQFGPACRFSSSARDFYCYFSNALSANPFHVNNKVIAGANTQLAAEGKSWVDGTITHESANGSSIKPKRNGAEQTGMSATDTSITSGLRAGMAGLAGGSDVCDADSFECGDLFVGSAYYYHQMQAAGFH